MKQPRYHMPIVMPKASCDFSCDAYALRPPALLWPGYPVLLGLPTAFLRPSRAPLLLVRLPVRCSHPFDESPHSL